MRQADGIEAMASAGAGMGARGACRGARGALVLLAVGLSSSLPAAARAQVVPVRITIASEYGGAGGRHPMGTGMNEASQVLGEWQSAFTPWEVPFEWAEGEGMTSIFSSRWYLAEPRALSDSGQVVGVFFDNAWTGFYPFTWTADGGAVEIPVPASPGPMPLAVNDRGGVAGVYGGFSGDPLHVFSWTAQAGVTELPFPQDLSSVQLLTLGDLGRVQAVGAGVRQEGSVWKTRLVFWTSTAGATEIADDDGLIQTRVAAVNPFGVVVGAVEDTTIPHTYQQAFAWTAGGGLAYLGTLGGATSSASAVNVLGQVAGASTLADGSGHPFLWSPAGGMTDLGLLPGGVSGEATALNDLGQVIGTNELWDGSVRAFSWTRGTGLVDLADAVEAGGAWAWAASSCLPVAVNNSGRVLANCSEDERPYQGPRLFKTDPLAELVILARQAIEAARTFGTAASLTLKLGAAGAAYHSGKTAASCRALSSFASEVTAAGAKKLDPGGATALLEGAADVETMLRCP